MSIINHGKWIAYKPETLPEGAPPNAMFAKREGDDTDWYGYVNSGENFGADNVKFMAAWRDSVGGYVVGPAVYDPTMLFPASQIVGEITDYTGTDPQNDLGGKIYDEAAGTFSDPPPVKAPPDVIAELLARIEALEARK